MAIIAMVQMATTIRSTSYMRSDVESAQMSAAAAKAAANSAELIEKDVEMLKQEVDATVHGLRNLSESYARLQGITSDFPFYVIYNENEGSHFHLYMMLFFENFLDRDGHSMFQSAINSGVFEESYTVWKDTRRNALDAFEVAVLHWLAYKSQSDYYFNRPSGWRYIDPLITRSETESIAVYALSSDDIMSIAPHNDLLKARGVYSHFRKHELLLPHESVLSVDRLSDQSGVIEINKRTFTLTIMYTLSNDDIDINPVLSTVHAPLGTNMERVVEWSAVPINITIKLEFEHDHIADLVADDYIYAKRLVPAFERNFSWPELLHSMRLVPSDRRMREVFYPIFKDPIFREHILQISEPESD